MERKSLDDVQKEVTTIIADWLIFGEEDGIDNESMLERIAEAMALSSAVLLQIGIVCANGDMSARTIRKFIDHIATQAKKDAGEYQRFWENGGVGHHLAVH